MEFQQWLQHKAVPCGRSPGEHLLRQGDVERELYVVESGLLKGYYLLANGKEMTKSFFTPGDTVGSLNALYRGGRCSFSVVCMEEVQLRQFSFEQLLQDCRADLELANHMIEALLALAMKKERREYEFLCLSAEARYERMLDEPPEWMAKVSQNELAKYLGITPVGLSRIKQRLVRPCRPA